MRDAAGFTLTELMMTLAVIIILAVIAIPSYNNHVLRSQRTDAKAALLRVAAEEEKFYIQNNRYGSLAELGDPTTEHGWYGLTIAPANAVTFTATATATAGGPQSKDKPCQTFSIDADGVRGATDGTDDTTELCW